MTCPEVAGAAFEVSRELTAFDESNVELFALSLNADCLEDAPMLVFVQELANAPMAITPAA
jgi:hypothetical protein